MDPSAVAARRIYAAPGALEHWQATGDAFRNDTMCWVWAVSESLFQVGSRDAGYWNHRVQLQFPPLAQNPDPAIFTHLNVLNYKCKDVFRYFWAGEEMSL